MYKRITFRLEEILWQLVIVPLGALLPASLGEGFGLPAWQLALPMRQ